MFGKKKDNAIHVQQYEGIKEFAIDYPVTIELKNDVFIVKRLKPETTVTLPLNRIKSFNAMEEKNYMLKYHGQSITTTKTKGIQKYYLVVEYDKGTLVFWGTVNEYKTFIDLQHNASPEIPSSIEL